MNHYTYSELSIGHTETFTVAVTDEHMAAFRSMTGDCNPLHVDDEYARNKSGFQCRIVYGMLTASFLSTLAVVYLPGEYALIHKVEVDFPAPVYVGDVIFFSGEIVRKDDNFKTIHVKVNAVNSNGKRVCRGMMRIGVQV